MSDDAMEPVTDETASAQSDPRDRRTNARRSGRDRRKGTVPPAGVERRADDRRGTERRHPPEVPGPYRQGERRINEYPLTDEELDFINAVNAYRQHYGRPFPTWSEVLHVVRCLGYTRPGEPGDADAEPPGA